MYGIVLEGGGARGAYQVGVWKALKELGVEYSGVAGTSVGAINGAMMVQGDLERAIELWSGLTPSQVVKLDEEVAPGDTVSLLHAVKTLFREGGMDVTPLRRLLDRCLDERRIRRSGIIFGLMTISLPDFNPLRLYLEDIPEGKMVDYLLASASLPVFRRQRVDGRVFLDGGVYDNLPISLLTGKGFKKIIAVRLTRKGLPKWKRDEGIDITVIKPGESLGAILDFSGEKAKKNIRLGYYDALRLLKGYKGSRYCIEVDYDEDYFFAMLLRIEEGRFKELADRLGLPGSVPRRRIILEKLVPLAIELLGLPYNASYQDLVIALLERAAERTGIERFNIYRYDQLYDKVVKRRRPAGGHIKTSLPRILQGNEIVLRAMGDQVLDEITDALLAP